MSDSAVMVLAAGLEERIAQASGRRHAVLTGNANTAMYVALRLIARRRGTGGVIVPTITCPSVPEIVRYAGFEPLFADVDLPECTMSMAAVRALADARTRAIVAIHIFGNPAPIAELCEFAGQRAIAVIEDAAQATGGRIDGRPIGSFGDFSAHSFGSTKIVTAGGGGALLTDDGAAAAAARVELAPLPPCGDTMRDALEALSHRNFCHGLTDLLRAQPDASVGGAFTLVSPRYREHYLRSFAFDAGLIERIGAGLDTLEENLDRRRAVARMYDAALEPFAAQVDRCEGWRRTGVVWRYTMLLRDPSLLLELTADLRRAGLDASNHYWSMAQLMEDRILPNSAVASPRLLNLWVDRSATQPRIDAAVEILRRRLSNAA